MNNKILNRILIWFLIMIVLFTTVAFAETNYFTNYHGEKVYYSIEFRNGVYTLTVSDNPNVKITNENQYEALNELEKLYEQTITIPRLAQEGNIKALQFLNYDPNISQESEEGFNRAIIKLKTLFDKYEAVILSLIIALAFIDFVWTLTKAKGVLDNPQIKKDFYQGIFNLAGLGLFLSGYSIIKVFIANWINKLLGNQNLNLESGLMLVREELNLVAIGLLGIGLLTSILFFIINFIKLGASAGNPKERAKALRGILINGITTAVLGSATMWFVFGLNIFR